jgi:multidrug efflux pump subunit AcrB
MTTVAMVMGMIPMARDGVKVRPAAPLGRAVIGGLIAQHLQLYSYCTCIFLIQGKPTKSAT